jgi:PAS domain S-box-containing protein
MEEVEFEVTTRTGQRRIWAFSASSPGTLRDGRRFVVGTAIDITERKKAEDLLRQSEERYRHLVYTLPAAVYTCDAEGTILLFNRAAVELWGREPETGVDKWCGSWRIFYPDGTPMPVDQCPMSEAIRTGRGIDGREIVIERPDGSRSSVMVYPHPVRDSSGAITGAVNMLVDITERKRSEESLRESRNAERTHRQELEALMQAAPAAMLIARDPDCDQITGNPTAYSMLRMSPGENMSKSAAVPTAASHFEVYCDGKLLPTEEMPIQKAARTGQPVENQELEWRFRDGTSTWVYGSTTPLFDDRSRVRGAVSTFVDITRLKRTEAALREAKAETEAASKAKDDFLATLSHELRTPLSPAILLASEWENNPTLPADARNAFAAIRKDIELEARLIDDLLDLTRVAHGKLRFTPEIADVHELLRETWVLLRPEAGEKQVKIRYELGAPVKWVKGDAVRLQQVFWNVIRNAVRFSPSGGMITIRTRGGERGRILIEIADRGTGIDKADHEKIFMPFSQGHRGTRAGALGLGLAISRSLVELHGGKIAVSSAGVGTGATFSIDLPVATEARSTIRTEEPVPSPVSSALRPRRILLVEDHTQTRNTLTKLLVRRGHEVVAAESARQAREIASTFEFDLVLSDLGLPDGSGHDLMADLRRLRPMCRGIALSGYGMESDIKRSRDAGFDIHLTKPIDVSTLESALRQAGNSHGIREF